MTDRVLADDLDAVVRVPVLMSVATTALVLSCSSRTVRRRITDGSLPAVIDHGRVMVRGDELRAYIDGLGRLGSPPGKRRGARSTVGRFEFLRE